MAETHPGLEIVCDRCNTRLWIVRSHGDYKKTYWVDGHDCKNIFIKKQVTEHKINTPVKGEN
jgi:hypothetical protein